MHNIHVKVLPKNFRRLKLVKLFFFTVKKVEIAIKRIFKETFFRN